MWVALIQSWLFQSWLIVLAHIIVILVLALIFAGFVLPLFAFSIFFWLPFADVQILTRFFDTIGIANVFLLACIALFCLLALLGEYVERPLITLAL